MRETTWTSENTRPVVSAMDVVAHEANRRMEEAVIDERERRVAMLRQILAHFGRALGYEHVAASDWRRHGILGAMTWASIEISRASDAMRETTA